MSKSIGFRHLQVIKKSLPHMVQQHNQHHQTPHHIDALDTTTDKDLKSECIGQTHTVATWLTRHIQSAEYELWI